MDRIVEIESLSDTRALAVELTPTWENGTVVALNGELGTGKTTFTQFVAEAIGVTQSVSSPTFKLISEYTGTSRKLYHIDCYRIESPRDFLEIGGENYLYPEDGITLIEWAENIKSLLPDNVVSIAIDRISERPDFRTFRLSRV